MSVLVIAKFQGDVGQFRQALTDRADEFAKIAEGSVGAAPAPPEITVTEAIASADQF
jgi:hypothetical protein